MTSNCSSSPLLGGYNILTPNNYFSRTYDNLPPHNIFYYQVRFFIIDDWQLFDDISLSFDSDTPTKITPYFALTVASTNLCGQTAYDDLPTYTRLGSVVHSSSSLTIQILSSISNPSSKASFGVRDISIVLVNLTGTPSDSSCGRALDDRVFAVWGECECARGKYSFLNLGVLACVSCDDSCAECFDSGPKNCYTCNEGYSYTSSGCIKCDDSCETCSGSGSNQCVTCQSGYWLQANNTCTTCNLPAGFDQQVDDFKLCQTDCSSGEFKLWDGTCLSSSSCPSPLVEKIIDGNILCLQPCENGKVLLWDGTCIDIAACVAPAYQRTENGISYCDACQSDYSRYPNGTCLDICDSPLQSKEINGSVFCSSPCDSSNFLWADGDCTLTCDFPYVQRIESIGKFCDYPCDSDHYLYPNKTCISSCKSPYVKSQDDNVDTCSYPCTTDSPYLYSDGSCLPTCPENSSYTVQIFDTIKLCQTTKQNPTPGLSEDDKKSVDSIADATETGTQVASVGVKIASILYSSNPKALSLASLDEMLMYIRYINVGYSPKLMYMFHQEGEASISVSFSPSLSESTSEKFEKYLLPENFEQYELDSSFFLNYWESFSSLLIVLAVVVVLSVITRFTKRFHNLHLVLYRIKIIAKWDFFLMIFYSSCDKIVFSSSLQFRTMHFNSFTSALSSLLCMTMVLLVVFILARTLYIIRDINKIKSRSIFASSASRHSALKKWEGYELLHAGYKRGSFFQEAFIFLFVLRICVFNIIIGYLFEYPLAQAILITLLSLTMLIYLSISRPFEETRDLVQLMIIEGLLFIVNFNVLILAILDQRNIEATNDRARIGDLIIVIKVIFVMLSLLFLFIDILLGIYEIIQGFRRSKDKGIKAVLQLFLAFFVPDGMVIEEKELKRSKTFARLFTRMRTGRFLEPKPTIVVSDADQILQQTPKSNLVLSLGNHNDSLLSHNNHYETSGRSNNTLQKEVFSPSSSTLLALSSFRKQRSLLPSDETSQFNNLSSPRSRPATATTGLSERGNLISTERRNRNRKNFLNNNFMENEVTEENIIVLEPVPRSISPKNIGERKPNPTKAFPTKFSGIAKKPIEFLPLSMTSAFRSRGDESKPVSPSLSPRQPMMSNEEIIKEFFGEREGERENEEFSLDEENYKQEGNQGKIKANKAEEEGKVESSIIFEEVYESQKKEKKEDKKLSNKEDEEMMVMDLDNLENGGSLKSDAKSLEK